MPPQPNIKAVLHERPKAADESGPGARPTPSLRRQGSDRSADSGATRGRSTTARQPRKAKAKGGGGESESQGWIRDLVVRGVVEAALDEALSHPHERGDEVRAGVSTGDPRESRGRLTSRTQLLRAPLD